MPKTVPLSLLDLAPVTEGGSLHATFENSVKLAQAAEKSGYRRFWMAEHHNMTDIASAATPVLLSYIAARTQYVSVLAE